MFDKVFIGTPTHFCKRYCAQEFVQAANLYASSKGAYHVVLCNSRADAAMHYRAPGVHYGHMPEIAVKWNGKPDSIHNRICCTMNMLRQNFLSAGSVDYPSPQWEWFLSLEADVILQPDTLERMLAWQKPVLHTNCYDGFHQQKEAGKVDRITLGCTLVHRSVVERFEFRVDPEILGAFHDAFLAHDCNNAGIEMFYDPTIILPHRHDDVGTRGWNGLPSSEKGR
jgi:hypothetical protein